MHDFKLFPELRNDELELYRWTSPHKQILYGFRAKVIKVHDGDTITVRCGFRDFDFPVRFLGTNAPELSEKGGRISKSWLENKILNEYVYVHVDPSQRVGKWGRILGRIYHKGFNLNEMSILMGKATPFDQRNEGQIPSFSKEVAEWLV